MATRRRHCAGGAVTWLRTPYHHHARVKGAGCGLCADPDRRLQGFCGLLSPQASARSWSGWSTARNGTCTASEELYLAWLERYGARDHTPAAGDVAIWRFGRTFSHAGILVDDHAVIHALQ
jgi:hypothetical protein